MRLYLIVVSLLALAALACSQDDEDESASRLQNVQDGGKVVCATLDDTPGFGFLDADGNLGGFDVDLCRAVAAATLGDADAVELRTIDAAERGPVMQAGEVDLLVWVTTWTSSRDAAWGDFVPTMFYDGQGFMVPDRLGVSSAYDLGGAAVCTLSGTTSELNVEDFFRQNRMQYNPTIYESADIALDAYGKGACDVFTTDRSALAGLRGTLPSPDEHMILPEVISEEPLTPLVPHGDSQWFDIVKTVLGILIHAEALGVNSGNVAQMTTSDSPKVKRLLGVEGSWGQADMGLDTTVAQTVITQVGNYGEIYDRHLGPNGIGLPREGGRNALWADAPCTDCPKGGQIYAAPLR
ncbi:MAG: amino acid ABC transporter substrate-binding protein [Chloroflexi bacterium]|nr:amino acid ABC transporter substrate-binding protein [Chloroflexota bacterium]